MNYIAAKSYILHKLDRELSPDLYYHGKHHTLDVLAVAELLCKAENIHGEACLLVKTAALYHDAGFTISNKEHEQLGCQLARTSLPKFGYSDTQIEAICGMILATKIPQNPKTPLEEILCDADLDYLGRDDFYSIGETLFKEFKAYSVILDEESWNRLQVNFLTSHHFHTNTNKTKRAPQKALYLQELKNLVATYS